MQWRTLPRRAYGRRGWWSLYTVGPRAALRAGPWAVLRAGPTAGPAGRRTDDADTYQWTSRPRAPGACSWSEPTAVRPGIGLGRLSLHTAGLGPDNPDRATRPQLLGTEAIGSGPGWHGRSGPGQSGMEWVEGGDCSKPSRDGPGSKCGVMGTSGILTT